MHHLESKFEISSYVQEFNLNTVWHCHGFTC